MRSARPSPASQACSGTVARRSSRTRCLRNRLLFSWITIVRTYASGSLAWLTRHHDA